MQKSSLQQTQVSRDAAEAWQLKMFSRSLKKQQKLEALLRMIGPLEEQRCLFLTCGDNNGALNWHLKQHGGNWTWGDAEKNSADQIQELTGDPVFLLDKEAPRVPYPDNSFDLVAVNDVHEHIRDPESLNRELQRVMRPGGRVVVTTPRGDEMKLAARLKNAVGMGLEEYGHVVAGYDIPDLSAQLRSAGLSPYSSTSYSFFFTELLELLINFAYVKVLSKRGKAKTESGQIAPQNKDQLKSVEKAYRMYALVYPIFWTLSRLDYLVRFSGGYAVVVAARKD